MECVLIVVYRALRATLGRDPVFTIHVHTIKPSDAKMSDQKC